jgi:hypothetical protein
MIDLLQNIGTGVGLFVSGVALLFGGASTFHTQPTIQPVAVALAVAPTQQMTAAVGASTTSQTSAAKTAVGKFVTASASTALPNAPATSPNIIAGVSKSYVDDQIQSLRNSISSDVFKNSSYLYPANAGISQAAVNAAISQRIDQLNNVTITNTTVHGVSGLTAADIPTGITASNYLPLAGGAVTGNLTVSGTASTSNLVVSNSFSLGTLSGVLKSVAGVVSATLVNLASDVTGILPIANGGTGTSTAPTYGKVLLGNASGGYDLVATSSLGITAGGSGSVGAGTAGQFAYFAGGGTTLTATSSIFLSTAGNVGLGTTSPFARLSIAGVAGGANNLFAISTSTAGFATSTALRISQNGNLHLMNGAGIDIGGGVIPPPNGLIVAGTASTSNLVVSNAFTFGSFGGVLKSVAGVVSATLVNLASDVTGILPIANGGTGTSTAPTYGKVLLGNASGGYDLAATSTLGLLGVATNAWSINLTGQVFYFEGSSITRGHGLGTAQLANGGLTGNYGYLLSTSIWGSGKATYYNDGVSGARTDQILSQYNTGNSTYGVTVPSAHSLSPSVTGSATRHIYFLELGPVYNDAGAAINTATSISNLTSLATLARSEGWFVVILTCPVIGTNAAASTQIAAVNQAARNGTIPSDMLVDATTWIPNQNDTTLYQGDALHPTAQGHKVMAANLLSATINGGSPVNYSGGYVNTPLNTLTGITATNQPAISAITVNASPNLGVGLVRLINPVASSYTEMAYQGTGAEYHVGVGNASETTYSLANKFYVWSNLDSATRLSIAPSAGISLLANFVGDTVVNQNSSASGYSSYAFNDNAGVARGAVAYGNASSVAPYASAISISSRGVGVRVPIKLIQYDGTITSVGAVLDSSGNFGVGTSTPYANLSVWGSNTACEPPRVCRRLFGLSHAAIAGWSSVA